MTDTSMTIHGYLAALRRRFWIVLVVPLVIGGAALAMSLSQTAEYRSSARVLLSHEDPASAVGGRQGGASSTSDAGRTVQTQAQVARSPELASQVVLRAGVPHMTPNRLLATSSVGGNKTADILEFAVTHPNRRIAQRLATVYADQYTRYKAGLETKPVRLAENQLRDRIDRIPSSEQSGSLFHDLSTRLEQLRTLEALETGNASLIQPSVGAVQTQPRTMRNVVAALVLGGLIGILLVWVVEALDTRVRSASEIEEALELPLLARVPSTLAGRTRGGIVPAQAVAFGPAVEPYRMLRANIELSTTDDPIRKVLIMGAGESEGKSTTVAHLAVAAARTGRRVLVIDLDLRRPTLHRFFGASSVPGITDATIETRPLEDCLQQIDLSADSTRELLGGELHLLASGTRSPNPGDFITSHRLERLLASIGSGYDLVIIDSPPVLRVGDALDLADQVDAILLVTRLGVVTRPRLRDLKRTVMSLRTRTIGVVVVSAELDRDQGQTYDYAYGYAPDQELVAESPPRTPAGHS